MSGVVYVIHGDRGLYKIGFTRNDQRRRLAMLRTSTPEQLTLVGVVPGTMDDEKELHRLLKPWRVAREWFRPCKAIDHIVDRLLPVQEGRSPSDHPLAKARAKAGLTQSDLAELVGITRVSIARIETSKQTPPIKTAARIINALSSRGVTLSADSFVPKPEAS